MLLSGQIVHSAPSSITGQMGRVLGSAAADRAVAPTFENYPDSEKHIGQRLGPDVLPSFCPTPVRPKGYIGKHLNSDQEFHARDLIWLQVFVFGGAQAAITLATMFGKVGDYDWSHASKVGARVGLGFALVAAPGACMGVSILLEKLLLGKDPAIQAIEDGRPRPVERPQRYPFPDSRKQWAIYLPVLLTGTTAMCLATMVGMRYITSAEDTSIDNQLFNYPRGCFYLFQAPILSHQVGMLLASRSGGAAAEDIAAPAIAADSKRLVLLPLPNSYGSTQGMQHD